MLNSSEQSTTANKLGVVYFEHVSRHFITVKQGRVRALQDVDFGVSEGEFTSIVGPSGCGKSTLLNLLAGLSFPQEGRVLFRGQPVNAVNTAVGYVTQDSNLLPWFTVLENVVLPLEIQGMGRSERIDRAKDWIERVGLRGFENHYPHQLSGGMQKRCSIARTLVYDPDVILMDEPYGPLDAITRMVLQAQLLQLLETQRKTILFVTHDLTEAISLSDHVVVMTRRPGQIKAIIDVPLERPRDVFHITESSGFAEVHSRLWDVFHSEIEEPVNQEGS